MKDPPPPEPRTSPLELKARRTHKPRANAETPPYDALRPPQHLTRMESWSVTPYRKMVKLFVAIQAFTISFVVPKATSSANNFEQRHVIRNFDVMAA